MAKICGIYKITSPSGKIYIGQSVNVFKRKRYYETENCSGQRKLYASIKKYGFANHKFEIICECDRDELNDREFYYISLYQTWNTPLGLNLQSGGDVIKESDETRLKRSKSLKGRVFSQEWKDKIGLKSKGRMIGFKHSEETRIKLRRKRAKWKNPHPKKGTGISKEEAKLRHRESNKKYRLKIKLTRITYINNAHDVILT
jgi:group I intron endonuclease